MAHEPSVRHERTVAATGAVEAALMAEITLQEMVELWEREHMRQHDLFAAAHTAQHDLMKTALDKAENVVRERLASMNEFRSALTDQAAKFVQRELLDQALEAQGRRIRALEELSHFAVGRDHGVGLIWSVGVSVAALGISVFSLILLALHRV